MKFLLDTHILLWWHAADQDRLSQGQRHVISHAGPDSPLLVCDISLWEVAMLYNFGRVRFTIPPREWIGKAVASPLVRRSGISPAIAAETASLPFYFHRDPADRILVASARVLGATLVTQDRRILESQLVDTLA